MRTAIEPIQLKQIYDDVSGHYDFQHGLLTFHSDQHGRKLVVQHAVKPGDKVLDCGAGTGSTSLLAARAAGSEGRVTLFDLSEGMLAVARERFAAAGLADQAEFQAGDLLHLPFPDRSFDVVLSTYSLCPVYDPAEGALEMFRVLKPGGRIGVAHSFEPTRPILKWLADRVENWIWHFPSISLGCRSVTVLPALQAAGTRISFQEHIGVPLWPFEVFVVEKPFTAGA